MSEAVEPVVEDEKPTAVVVAEPDAEEPEEVLSIFDLCETDVDAEEGGKWFINVWPKADVKLRRLTSRASIRARIRFTSKYRKFAKNNEFSEAQNIKILNEQLAEAVILDWRGEAFKDRDGQAIPFSKPACLVLLEKMPNFRIALALIAQDMDNFRVEVREAVEKN